MKSISPYLLFPGNTEKVFDFYKSVFDGEILALQDLRMDLMLINYLIR